jgi:hypothetical protein
MIGVIVAVLVTLLLTLIVLSGLAVYYISKSRRTSPSTNESEFKDVFLALEAVIMLLQAQDTKYKHANGMYAWYVVYTALTSRDSDEPPSVNHTSTIFVSSAESFVPALFAGCLKRVHECSDILIHNWVPLTETEFNQQREINNAVVKDPALFN